MRSDHRTHRSRLPRALPLLLALGACEIEDVAIPRTPPRLALHGVLTPSAPSQLVLLERVRNGSVALFGPPFDQYPLAQDEGIAESGALMRLTTPDGQTIQGVEEVFTTGNNTGQGIYRFALSGSALVRGATYRLTVQAQSGEVLEATASVPGGDATPTAEARTFERGTDTLALEWPASPGARSYFVRIETPYGPLAFFTSETRLRLPGLLRNVDAGTLPRVFFPGFQQAVTVSAVDSNFYDWYRSSNNTFTGTGLVNRVQGGLGVFGSAVRLRFLDLHVVTPQTEPGTGRFEFDGPPEQRATTPNLALELYVESRAQRAGQGDALSGRYEVRPRFGYVGCLTCGAFGTLRNGRLTLALLRDWSGADTVDILDAEVRGDTIAGSYRAAGGLARFVRRR